MAEFKDYLKFSDEIEYIDKQIKVLGEIIIPEEVQEKLSNIGHKIKMLVFAHPKCKDSVRVIATLEAMRRYIPDIEIDYRKRSEDKELLLKYSPEGKIPALFLIDGIKVTRIFSEQPEKLKKDIENNPEKERELIDSFHLGSYDEEIRKDILNKLLGEK